MASLTPPPPLPSVSQNATPPSSPTNSTATPPPSTTPSAPSPQLSAPPPSLPTSPPPETSPPPTLPVAPPPGSPPPPSTPSSPPQSTPSSPPQSPPTAPPPSTNSPPPLTASPPPPPQSPAGNSPPPESPAIPLAPPPSNSSSPPESPATPVAPPPSPPATSTSPPPPTTSPPSPSGARPPENSPPTQPATPTLPPPASSPSPSNRSSSPSTPSIAPPPNNTSTNSSLPAAPARPPPFRPAENPTAGSSRPSPNTVSQNNSGGLNGATVAVLGSIAGLLALSLVVLAVWVTHKRKKRKELFSLRYTMPSPFASSQDSGSSFLRSNSTQLAGSVSASNTNYKYSPDGGGGLGSSRSWFSYQELFDVTNGFSEYNVLGEGGFGCVYKGVLSDGREVAIKQLKAGSGQGEREFQAEVEIISRIHHRHLVSLVGYCISENQRLLVYDYVPNDTLHHHLHAQGKQVMNWASRVKVAAGAARGMAYLHEDCQPRIIHRDIKSTNILLENNFEARVADFGLAKLAQDLDIQTHVSTRVMGTFGYMAPEYASTGKLTDKSDVYSFGVVLLELITGRKSVDSAQPVGDESLVEWARPLLTQALDKEEFGDIVDPKLEDNFVPSEMFRMIEAAAACVRHLASKRPKMSQVARALDSMDDLADLNNGMKPGESGIFNSREHSAQLRMFQRMAFGSQDYSSGSYDISQSSWRS